MPIYKRTIPIRVNDRRRRGKQFYLFVPLGPALTGGFSIVLVIGVPNGFDNNNYGF